MDAYEVVLEAMLIIFLAVKKQIKDIHLATTMCPAGSPENSWWGMPPSSPNSVPILDQEMSFTTPVFTPEF